MPPSEEKLKWVDKVSVAIHGLITTAIFTDLVFTALAGNRGDNDTVFSKGAPSPSPSPSLAENPNGRPTKRLLIFGGFFVAYLALKAYQLTIEYIWYKYKKVLDEGCIWLGGFSLMFLVYTTSMDFVYYVVGPVFGVLVIGRYLLLLTGYHENLLEVSYVPCLKLRKCLSVWYSSLKVFYWTRKEERSRAYPVANQRAKDALVDAEGVVNEKTTHWNDLIQQAKSRAPGYIEGGGGGGAVPGGEIEMV